MVPFLLLLEGVALFSVWSDIREIDAQPAMSDNGAEVVNLSAPQQWHTTLDLTAGPVTFRNGGSPLATTTVVVAELLGRERVVYDQLDRRLVVNQADCKSAAPLSSLRGRRSYGR